MKIINGNNNGLKYVICDELLRDRFGVQAVFSTRLGGVSEAEHLQSLNLGFDRNDNTENVIRNYEIIAKSLGFELGDIFTLNQKHTDIIYKICSTNSEKNTKTNFPLSDISFGINKLNYTGDAMITNEKGKLLSIRIADCVPILYFDEKTMSVGAAHCGWRGTYQRLQQKTFQKMKKEYGASEKTIKVFIGPSVSSCCYEVEYDFYEKFRKEFGSGDKDETDRFFLTAHDENHKFCDLKGMNKKLLINAGIKEENIIVSEYCTCCDCNKELFYSHRRDKLLRGSLAAFIGFTETH